MIQLGIDRITTDQELIEELKGRRLALVAHPASVNHNLKHSLNALIDAGLSVTCAFGPQHGLKGEKQDNMIESDDYIDPQTKIPVYSLYGKSRKPLATSMAQFDVCLFDLQDVGTRIYTFLTTLLYMMEACQNHQKEIWILDRPNPAGRPVEGLLLRHGWESFVGAAAGIPMRHGLTMGEMAIWLKQKLNLKVHLKIIEMNFYHPHHPPFYGWPESLAWVNPSPNAASPHMAKIYPGSVFLEGTTLSEGRGTTKPLEVIGAPDLNFSNILTDAQKFSPIWFQGAVIRPCFFEPTFHKHKGTLCSGLQFHCDNPNFSQGHFQPYRIFAALFKAIRNHHTSYELWRNFPYEYETERLAIDLINGSSILREWVDFPKAKSSDLESMLIKDESHWKEETRDILLYT